MSVYRTMARYRDGTPKTAVSPDFMATLIHQGASLRTLEAIAANMKTFDVFEAHRNGEINAEMGALILELRHRGRLTWWQRVFEAIRWWT